MTDIGYLLGSVAVYVAYSLCGLCVTMLAIIGLAVVITVAADAYSQHKGRPLTNVQRLALFISVAVLGTLVTLYRRIRNR